MNHSGFWATIGLASMLAGCGSGNAVTPDKTAAACVSDPASVVQRLPTAASLQPMPAADAAPIAAAAAAGFAASHSPGAVVAVRTPQGTWIQAFGVADVATGAPMVAGTHQRVGSVTKSFTATILMQLVAQGKVALDDPISKYVPGVPNGSEITLLDLARMRSGLADYANDAEGNLNPEIFDDTSRSFTLDQLVAMALALPPLAPPDTVYHYSNTNYILLQKVAEAVTGEDWNTLLATDILGPLHLAQTSYPGQSAELPEPFAQGYTPLNTPDPLAAVKNGTLANSTNWNPSWAAGAGEMISTASDLLTWGRALATGQGILPAAAQIQRLRAFLPADGLQGNYGIGMICSAGWVGHTGLIPGYNTSVRCNVDGDDTVIVETNTDFPATMGPPIQMTVDPMVIDIAQALGHPIPAPVGNPPES